MAQAVPFHFRIGKILHNGPHANTDIAADLSKTAIGYVRVSTKQQAAEGVSLDTQRDKLRRGRANTLIVAKLDRLSRSLRDVCTLVSDYFIDENHHLLSSCGLVNTLSAAGRMLLMSMAACTAVGCWACRSSGRRQQVHRFGRLH